MFNTGALMALLSAALFGASTPLAKLLLGGGVDPWLLAGLLYLGSGVGLGVLAGRQGPVAGGHDDARGETIITEPGVTPLLVCDLWEHAYYLDHKIDRAAAFLTSWWDRLANWSFAEQQFATASGEGAAWTFPAPTV